MLKDDSKTPIDINLLLKMGQATKDANNTILFKENAVVFKEDNEFYAQTSVLRDIAHLYWAKETNNLDEDSFFQASPQDKYKTKMRTDKTITINQISNLKGM